MSNLAEQIRDTPTGRMRIISIEGLIGFKLQGLVRDAMRTREAGALFSHAGATLAEPLPSQSG